MRPPDDFDPPIGKVEELAPGVRRIVAPNPSPMTYRGTNTYMVGSHDVAIIDPGPLDNDHLVAILEALGPKQRITHIFVTHSHLDHSPLASPLSKTARAPVLAFGGPDDGRSVIMQELAKSGLVGGGEGRDKDFCPDHRLTDGETISGSNWSLEVIHTPGHLGNHLCLALGDTCFTADHVMGWASSLVSPPDGDLTDFMTSCAKLRRRSWRIFYPGHGAPIDDPNARLDWLVAHRCEREKAILRALTGGPATPAELAHKIYYDVAPNLMAAAMRNVLSHLIDLTQKSEVAPVENLHADAKFRLLPPG